MHPAHQPKHLHRHRHPSRTRSPRFSAARVPDPTALPRERRRTTCASCGDALERFSLTDTCDGCASTRTDFSDDGELFELEFEGGK